METEKDQNKDEEKESNPQIPKINIKPPPLPKVTPPTVNIRPNVQNMIDNLIPNLTEHELQYLIQKIQQVVRSGVKPSRTQNDVNPLYKDMTEGLKELEEVVTVGYPKFFLSPSPETDNRDALDAVLDLLRPLFESPKVQDQLARILGAIADKLEVQNNG
jgi:hypothetical protein